MSELRAQHVTNVTSRTNGRDTVVFTLTRVIQKAVLASYAGTSTFVRRYFNVQYTISTIAVEDDGYPASTTGAIPMQAYKCDVYANVDKSVRPFPCHISSSYSYLQGMSGGRFSLTVNVPATDIIEFFRQQNGDIALSVHGPVLVQGVPGHTAYLEFTE